MVELEQRVATALAANDTSAAALAELLSEVDTAITVTDKSAEEERVRALDPLISPDPKAALAALQEVEFGRDRLKTLQPRLQQHYLEIKRQEELAAWQVDFARVAPIHAAMVEEFTTRYPKLISELANLMHRIATVDQMVRQVQIRRLPNTEEFLEKIEVAARGHLTQPDVVIATDLRLPYLFRDGGPIYAWPPEQKLDFNHPMFRPAPYNPAYTADWALAREQRAQRQREEFEQREAQYQRQQQEAQQRREQELREARAAAAQT